MAIQKGIDAATGQEIEWDDEVTLIDGHPDLKPPSPEAVNPASEPVPFHKAPEGKQDWRTQKAPQPSGYTSPVDDEEWKKKFWPGPERV